MKAKVLVVDVDGTLVNSKKQITEPVKKALIKVQEAGVKVVIASGRSVPGVMLMANQIDLKKYGGYILTCNGARITNVETGEIIHDVCLPAELIPEIHEFAKKHHINIMTYHDNEIIAETTECPYINLDATGCKINVHKVEDFTKEVTYPVNKCLLTGEPERMEAIEEAGVKQFDGRISVYRSEEFYLEMMPLGVDKAYGLAALLKRLGCDSSELICCGDGYNDISMIEFAGLGVAMANATEEVQAHADYVAPSCDEDGLCDVIERYVL